MGKVEWFVIDVKPEEKICIYLPMDEIRFIVEKFLIMKGKSLSGFLNELTNFFKLLYEKWWNSEPSIRSRYALNISYLCAKSTKDYVYKAKKNAICAYCVLKRYISAYTFVKNKVVAGAESIYTWMRMYKALGFL